MRLLDSQSERLTAVNFISIRATVRTRRKDLADPAYCYFDTLYGQKPELSLHEKCRLSVSLFLLRTFELEGPILCISSLP